MAAMSKLSMIKVLVPHYVLAPAVAKQIVARGTGAKQPAELVTPVGAEPEEMTMRDIVMIAGLDAKPDISHLSVKEALSQAGEPPLALTDFGAPLLPGGEAVLLTATPLTWAIAGVLHRAESATGQVSASGALFLPFFRLVQSYINSLMTGQSLYYPNDGFAQHLRSQAGEVFARFGINCFTMNGQDNPFFSLPDNREVTDAAFREAHKQTPRLGVVLAYSDGVDGFIDDWFARHLGPSKRR